VGVNGGSGPSDAVCNKKLREEVSADITRAVGVFLNSRSESLAAGAEAAARAQVSKAKVARGEGLVDPIATAVEYSVNAQFQTMAAEIKPTVKIFIQTALKRLCTLENCCFEQE